MPLLWSSIVYAYLIAINIPPRRDAHIVTKGAMTTHEEPLLFRQKNNKAYKSGVSVLLVQK
ncbi:hypothetical protein [Flavobacterium rivuli]|uniref:hypothetical protein n=1 Tax=Flavobacterium rivuli TaxID=498301 RepID=UPI0003AA166F|nr:hypothetical protein [Flavobacterium rivuli]